jgi:hypothetical protein
MFNDCDIVSTYTADQAIEDGVLVYPYPDKFPNLLLTRSIFELIDAQTKADRTFGQACLPFLQDVAYAWNRHVKRTQGQDGLCTETRDLWGNVTGRNDLWIAANEKGGITVMLPEDY